MTLTLTLTSEQFDAITRRFAAQFAGRVPAERELKAFIAEQISLSVIRPTVEQFRPAQLNEAYNSVNALAQRLSAIEVA